MGEYAADVLRAGRRASPDESIPLPGEQAWSCENPLDCRRGHAFCFFRSVACGGKTPTLSLLVWEGYADSSYVRAFEQSHHCRISASYMGSSDELVAKLRGGSASNYDVISPSSDVATMIASSGLAAPLDLSKIPSYNQLSEKLRLLPLVRVNGTVYGVPFTWGPNPLLYDTTCLPDAAR